jgi:GAF domain-containing protein
MDQLGNVTVGKGLIGRVAQTGEIYIAGEGSSEHALPQEAGLTACVPLRLEDRVTGVIALFRLLPQKSGIADLDRELFDMLAVHAAVALYCTGLHARLGTATPR